MQPVSTVQRSNKAEDPPSLSSIPALRLQRPTSYPARQAEYLGCLLKMQFGVRIRKKGFPHGSPEKAL